MNSAPRTWALAACIAMIVILFALLISVFGGAPVGRVGIETWAGVRKAELTAEIVFRSDFSFLVSENFTLSVESAKQEHFYREIPGQVEWPDGEARGVKISDVHVTRSVNGETPVTWDVSVSKSEDGTMQFVDAGHRDLLEPGENSYAVSYQVAGAARTNGATTSLLWEVLGPVSRTGYETVSIVLSLSRASKCAKLMVLGAYFASYAQGFKETFARFINGGLPERNDYHGPLALMRQDAHTFNLSAENVPPGRRLYLFVRCDAEGS